MKNQDLSEAMNTICWSLKHDPEYYYGWQANLAMSFVDNAHWSGLALQPNVPYGLLHATANQAAKHFLDILIRECHNPDEKTRNIITEKRIDTNN